MSSILIIDDEDSYFELCRRFMPEYNFLPPVHNYREAITVLKRLAGKIDLVLLDVHFAISEQELLPYNKQELLKAGNHQQVMEELRRNQGFQILNAIRQDYPDLPLIVMTSHDDLPLEVDAERLRAENYTYLLADDYLDARSLKLQIDTILARKEVQGDTDQEPFYWGSTTAMHNLRRRLAILARGRLPIIIQGATGTGKSLLARNFIHPHSGRLGPFVAVDLSIIPQELMAAHLFGVVKGAYTGATSTRAGVLEQAQGGTLFLDEIGNLSLELQKSLLLVLQEGVYRSVGDVKERTADIKLVVATNEDLKRMVAKNQFREDLYMRLNPSTAVTLPSLSERRDDFHQLLQVFLRRAANEVYNRDLLLQYAMQRGLSQPKSSQPFSITVGSEVPPELDLQRIHFLLPPTSLSRLKSFAWPGNFRQFEMTLSNLLTLTLVDLVERAEKIEPEGAEQMKRVDVIPILPKTVNDLLKPMQSQREEEEPKQQQQPPTIQNDKTLATWVRISQGKSLNDISCAVEKQYLAQLYEHFAGDLNQMGEALLGDANSGRKIQLRMNQLGIKLRNLIRKRGL